MDISAFPPITALLTATTRTLTGLADLLDPVAGSAATALAIVLATLAVRVLLMPLGVLQVRADLDRRRLAPRLRALQHRHRADPAALQRATLDLHRAEGVSPIAGLGSSLLQLPVVATLYTVLSHASIAGAANPLLAAALAEVPLGASLGTVAAGGLTLWPALPIVLLVLAALVVTAWLGRRQTLAWAASSGAPVTRTTRLVASTAFLSVVFAAVAPLSAGLYLVVTTGWTVLERGLLRRLLGAPAMRAAA